MEFEHDEQVIYFGETDARNRRLRFGIKRKDRSRHMYAIGKTGMGKSTLLENLAVQDIQNGDGICFIDPHGKSADLLLEYVPEHRIKDVVYFAPFDMEYPASFNVMEDVGPEKRYLVANGLMSAFKKIWVDAWSARMEYILGNIMLALLEYPGSTLVGVNRMLTDKDFRKEVVNNITDPSVKSFWVNEYANYTDKFAAEAAPAIQNKVGQFIANPLIRNIIGQPKSSFDIRQIMEERKILIINLSKGRVGEANANLLGSMLITKIYLAAMSRADLKEKELAAAPNFYLYVDEFQSFANESFADILSEARKYKLNLCIAHQYIEQMTDEVRAAVFGNVGTMCIYRVGAYDAEVLEKEFAPYFTAEDIVNLQKYQMYLKLMIDGVTSQPFSAAGMAPIPKPEISYLEQIITSSRQLYAKPRQMVEDELLEWINRSFTPGKGGGSSSGGSGSGVSGGSGSGSSSGSGASGGNTNGGARPSGASGSGGPGASSSATNTNNRPSSSNHSGGFNPGSGSGSNGSVRASAQGTGTGYKDRGGQTAQRDNREAKDSRDVPRRTEGGQRYESVPQQRSDGSSSPQRQEGSVPQSQERRPRTASENRQSVIKESNARENKFRNAISLGYLKAEQKPKEDPKDPKPENLNALRDALLSVMGNSVTVNKDTDNESGGNDKVSRDEINRGGQREQSGRDERRDQVENRGENNNNSRREPESINNQSAQSGGGQNGHSGSEKQSYRTDRTEEKKSALSEVSDEELKKILG
jgi:hypothetical protein